MLWFIHTLLESLPISSSGHLRLIRHLINDKNSINSNIEFLMHIPTAIVLLMFLWVNKSTILPNFYHFFDINFFDPRVIKIFCLVFIADAITVTFYLLFNFINCIDVNKFPLYLGFLITSLLLLLTGIIKPGYNHDISFTQAALIGLAQSLALLPGISRMAATYTVGYALGISAFNSLLFSCLIELPLVLVAILKALYFIKYKNLSYLGISFDINLAILLALFISVIISYLLLCLVSFLACNNYLWYLGVYMFIPTMVSFLACEYKIFV